MKLLILIKLYLTIGNAAKYKIYKKKNSGFLLVFEEKAGVNIVDLALLELIFQKVVVLKRKTVLKIYSIFKG